MWAQSWESIYPLVEPFSMAGTRPDATPEIQKLEIDEMYVMAFIYLRYHDMIMKTPWQFFSLESEECCC